MGGSLRLLSRKFSNDFERLSLITATKPNCKISEQYRTIRTNFLMTGSNSRKLVITSPNGKEGKSTTAANFAISLAQQGKRVLLIDADLREPTLHLIFDVDNTIGLSNVLFEKKVFESAIIKTEIKGLDFLPSGPLTLNPADLLGSKTMGLLIEAVTRFYDVVIFDTPAVLDVADTKIIANLCDSLILVIRSGKTKNEEAVEAKRLLESTNAKLLGIILNDKG